MVKARRIAETFLTQSDQISGHSGFIAAMAGVVMIVIIVVEIVMRIGFRVPTLIGVEVGEYLLAAVVFLGASYTLREKGHIRIDFVLKRFPPKKQKALNLATMGLTLTVTILLVWYGWRLIIQSYTLETEAWSALRTPLFIPQILMGVGLILLLMQVGAELLRQSHNVRE
jgi:TRAP-type C4-dicarboxylate transport system permease small subunit